MFADFIVFASYVLVSQVLQGALALPFEMFNVAFTKFLVARFWQTLRDLVLT